MMLCACIFASEVPMADITCSVELQAMTQLERGIGGGGRKDSSAMFLVVLARTNDSVICLRFAFDWLTLTDAHTLQSAFSLLSPFKLFIRQFVLFAFFTLCTPTKHLSHTPSLDPFKSEHTLIDIDHPDLGNDDSGFKTSKECTCFCLHACFCELDIKNRMAIAFRKAIFEQDRKGNG